MHKDLINEIDVADDKLVNDEVDIEAAAIMTQKQRPMSSGTFSNMIPSQSKVPRPMTAYYSI